MKLALDPQMYYSTASVFELPDIVARLGYEWLELSPKDDFIPLFRYPRVDGQGVARLRRKAADAGVGIASVLPVMHWSGPDEDQRRAAVRAWRRAIEITVDLGVSTMTSEFSGRPEANETAEGMFLHSLEELAPVFEREGVQLVIEPHPDDFLEGGHDAVRFVKGLDRDWIGFLYCTPHTFHQGNDAPGILAEAGPLTRYVHLADSLDHTASNGLRYIVNPPGSPARVHQHAEMGRGEVDFDEAFAALAAIGFDGVLSSCVFGWEEDRDGISVRQRERATALIRRHFEDPGRVEHPPRQAGEG